MISYREFIESTESEDEYGPLFRHLSPSQHPELEKHIDQTLDDYKASQMAAATSGDMDSKIDRWFDEIKYKGQIKIGTNDLVRDIEALFADLKNKVRDATNPRKNWLNNLQGWLRDKNMLFRNESAKANEKPTLLEYASGKKFFDDFRIALNETQKDFMDDVIDNFKERFKQIVLAHYAEKEKRVNAVLGWMDARKDELKDEIKTALKTHYGNITNAPRDVVKNRIKDYIAPRKPMPHDTIVGAPSNFGKYATDVSSSGRDASTSFDVGGSKSDYSVDTHTPPSNMPEPAIEPAKTTTPEKTTAPSPAQQQPQEESEDKLVNLGILVAYARRLFAKKVDELTQDDIDQTFNMLKGEMPDIDPSEKDQLIDLAKTYQNKNVASSPTAGDTQAKSAATEIESLIAIPSEEEFNIKVAELTKTLSEMSANKFKKYILANDPELAEAYEGEKWWSKSMRNAIVEEHLDQIKRQRIKTKQSRKKQESVSYMTEKYKTLLRQPYRPQFLLKEAVKLPLKNRIEFYKEKLSYRGT